MIWGGGSLSGYDDRTPWWPRRQQEHLSRMAQTAAPTFYQTYQTVQSQAAPRVPARLTGAGRGVDADCRRAVVGRAKNTTTTLRCINNVGGGWTHAAAAAPADVQPRRRGWPCGWLAINRRLCCLMLSSSADRRNI